MKNALRKNLDTLYTPLMISLTLHLVVLILSFVSLPFLQEDLPEPVETPIVVDLVQVAERTAAPPPGAKTKEPPKEQPRQEIKKPEPPKEDPRPEPQKVVEPPKPEPPKPEPPKPPTPKEPPPPPKEQPKPEPPKPEPPKPEPPKPDPPKTKPEPPKKEPEKAEKAPDAPPKPEPKKEEPKKEEPKKEEAKKEEPKKPEPPKKEEARKDESKDNNKPTPKETSKDSKKPTDDDPFKDLVKNVEKFRPTSSPQQASQQPANPQQQAAASGPQIRNAPIAAQATMSEVDAIRAQVEPKWRVDPGVMGIEKMVILLRVTINPDGSVVDVRVEPQSWGQYNSDVGFRAMTDSAILAVRRSSPLKYPQEKYETFKSMVISFRPQSVL